MRNAIIVLLSLACYSLTAQVTSAKVTYLETVTFSFGTNEDVDPGMKALLSQLPKEKSVSSTLLFNDKAATYAQNPGTADEMKASNENVTISFNVSESDPEVYYVDLTEKKTLQTRSIFDKKFQIEDDLPSIEWTLLEETKTDEESALPVNKAMGINSEGDTLTAWYTNSIPVSIGPRAITGLPGLIVSLEKGKTTYQVTNIELLSEEPEVLPPFTKGKTVSLQKFKKIEQQKMDALQKEMKGKAGSNTIIIGG